MTTTTDETDDAILARADAIRERQAAEARAAKVATYADVLALLDGDGWSALRAATLTLADRNDLPRTLTNAFASLAQTMDTLPLYIPYDARPGGVGA